MKKIYIVMEHHNSMTSIFHGDPDDLASTPRKAFFNKDDAKKYADELTKSEGLSYDDVHDEDDDGFDCDDDESYEIVFKVREIDVE